MDSRRESFSSQTTQSGKVALRSPIDDRDWLFEALAKGSADETTYPEELNLSEHIGNHPAQGVRGTCAAITGAIIREINLNRQHRKAKRSLSAEFIYYHRQNKPSSGMYGRDVFKVLKRIGTVDEEDFPYHSSNAPTDELYEKARDNRITAYARVTTITGLKTALCDVGPAYLLLPLYESRPNFWKGETLDGGHAVAVIGYNKHGFVIENAWQKTVSLIFPYKDWDDHWECWVPMCSEVIEYRSVEQKNKCVTM